MWKITKVRGPWETEGLTERTVSKSGRKNRQSVPLLIEIEPRCISYRVKGTRRRFRLTHQSAYLLAVRAEVEANRRNKPIRRGALAL